MRNNLCGSQTSRYDGEENGASSSQILDPLVSLVPVTMISDVDVSAQSSEGTPNLSVFNYSSAEEERESVFL